MKWGISDVSHNSPLPLRCTAGDKLCSWVSTIIQSMKGRLIVPSKFREQLGDEFVVTKGLDNCLFVYENSEWAALEEKLRTLPLTNAAGRKFSRFLLAGATACEVDKQGRILLPAVLREFAGIEKDAVLVGVGSRIEIWSKDKWLDANTFDDMEEIAEHMEGLGI